MTELKNFRNPSFFSQSSPKNQLGRGADWFKVILNFNGESQLEKPKKNRKNPHSFSIISSHILVIIISSDLYENCELKIANENLNLLLYF